MYVDLKLRANTVKDYIMMMKMRMIKEFISGVS